MLQHFIEMASQLIEIMAVLIILGGIINAGIRYLFRFGGQLALAYKPFKERIGKAMLLGLELMVAADIIRTVAIDTTIQSAITLGMLVLIRTFLSWSLSVEIDGHWPWKSQTNPMPQQTPNTSSE